MNMFMMNRISQILIQSQPLISIRYSSINIIPSIIIDNNKSAGLSKCEHEELQFSEFNKVKSNPTGLVKIPWPDPSVGSIVPSTTNTLKQCFTLCAKGHLFTSWTESVHELIGYKAVSMLTSFDEKHKTLRAILNPFFADAALKHRFDIIQHHCKILIASLVSNTENQYHHVLPRTKTFAFDVVFGVIFGNDLNTKELSDKLIKDCGILTHGFRDFNMENLHNCNSYLGQGMMARHRMLNELGLLITKCIQLYDENKLDPTSIIYKMIDGKVFTDLDNKHKIDMIAFKDNLLNVLWAGHDTTASTLCNLMYVLNKYKDHSFVKKLRNELFSRNKEQLHSFEFIAGDPLLDAFINEVMRYIPTVFETPKVLRQDVTMNGCPLKEGDIITVNHYISSKNENVFGDDVNEFNPQRFIDNPPSKQVWFPFGFGTSKCLGHRLASLELKVVAVMLLQYDIKLDQNKLMKSDSFFHFYNVHGRLCNMR